MSAHIFRLKLAGFFSVTNWIVRSIAFGGWFLSIKTNTFLADVSNGCLVTQSSSAEKN